MNSPTANLTKFQSISFGVAIELFIDTPALLCKIEDNQEITAHGDKRVVFYIDEDNPRHFRSHFIGARTALSLHIDLIEYMLMIGRFVHKDAIGRLSDMTGVAGILHTTPDFADHQRVYLDRESFEHLFGGHIACRHKATDIEGRAHIIDYHDDRIVGALSVLNIRKTRRRGMSVNDLYIAEKFKAFPQKCFAVHEGRGWLWLIDVSC